MSNVKVFKRNAVKKMTNMKKQVIQPTTVILGIMQQVNFKWVTLIPGLHRMTRFV